MALKVWRSRCGLASAAVLGALMAGEVLLRIAAPQPLWLRVEDIWEPLPKIGHHRRPNLDVRVEIAGRATRVVTDARRHRVAAARVRPARHRALAIGDSFVEALQVDYEQSMTALVEERVGVAGPDVAILNAGVGGWDPNHYLIATRSELAAADYAAVIVFVFLHNDIVETRNHSFEPTKGITPPELDSSGPSNLLESSGNRAHLELARRSHLYVFGWQQLLGWRMRGAKIEHNSYLRLLARSLRDDSMWRTTAEVLADLAAAATEHGARTAFVLIPPEHYLDTVGLQRTLRAFGLRFEDVDVDQPRRRLSEEMRRAGLSVFDATDVLRNALASDAEAPYGEVDKHLSASGHRVMAAFLEPIVMGLVSSALREGH